LAWRGANVEPTADRLVWRFCARSSPFTSLHRRRIGTSGLASSRWLAAVFSLSPCAVRPELVCHERAAADVAFRRLAESHIRASRIIAGCARVFLHVVDEHAAVDFGVMRRAAGSAAHASFLLTVAGAGRMFPLPRSGYDAAVITRLDSGFGLGATRPNAPPDGSDATPRSVARSRFFLVVPPSVHSSSPIVNSGHIRLVLAALEPPTLANDAATRCSLRIRGQSCGTTSFERSAKLHDFRFVQCIDLLVLFILLMPVWAKSCLLKSITHCTA